VSRGAGGVDRLAARGVLLRRRRILPSLVDASCLRGRADLVPLRWRERRAGAVRRDGAGAWASHSVGAHEVAQEALKQNVALDICAPVNYSSIKMRPTAGQLALRLTEPSRWGGARRGAGRKRTPGRRPSVPHRARRTLDARHPALVTLRARPEVTWLRSRNACRAVIAALSASSRPDFRVVHFSVQRDHVHLIVEANDTRALSRGMRGLAIRCALGVNRALGRCGALWSDRYHALALSTPRMVRNALVYVLANARKHLALVGIDPCSSARWFDGFAAARPASTGDPPTRPPRTWLLRVGWRRHGLIDREEGPRRVRRRSSSN
jgi:putative transposase